MKNIGISFFDYVITEKNSSTFFPMEIYVHVMSQMEKQGMFSCFPNLPLSQQRRGTTLFGIQFEGSLGRIFIFSRIHRSRNDFRASIF